MKDFFVIAHNIRSLQNVGSIFRTCDAFGVTKLYLTGYTGTPTDRISGYRLSKVALGAEQFVLWEHKHSVVVLIKQLKAKNVRIIALENNVQATMLKKLKPQFPIALVLGEERYGIKKPILALCDEVVEIPMVGKKESLNVSVAFGVVAYKIMEGRG